MRFLISGYYGYDNAGDEAVLAAVLDHISSESKNAQFVVTSGNPTLTKERFSSPDYALDCVARDDFKGLWKEIQSCDAFLSGGGSLLQDSTSLRNIVYYTTLIRLAHLAGKPAMVYAQGIGPLKRNLSRKLTRAALANAKTRAITLRDPDSRQLLQEIGVRREMEVTADPVWDLALRPVAGNEVPNGKPTWCVALRSWPEAVEPNAERDVLKHIQEAAQKNGARLRYLAMQPERDRTLIEGMGVPVEDILPTENRHPGEIMAMAGNCDVMIGMRLHALIFAAAQGIPCVAISYDPKVKSLASIIQAPVIESASPAELAKLEASILSATAPSSDAVQEMKGKARRNAQLAAALK